MNPRFSVIVPVYNAVEFLPQALASIRAQGMEALEIILVDDGSSDGSAEWAETQPDVRVIRQENAGPSAARNRGLEEARGEFIAFLDADDLWPDYKLRLQSHWLDLHPHLEVVQGRVQWQSLNDSVLPEWVYDTTDQARAFINIGAALWRRSAFERIGPFDTTLRFGEDHDWFLRAREVALPMLILRDITLHYRLHGGNMTNGKSASAMGLMQVLRRSLARRRAAGGVERMVLWSEMEELVNPTVSVVIPVYNGARFLRQAIESALAQTVAPLEILVADDGSEDESAAIAESFGAPVRVIRLPHGGQVVARNAACAEARGSLLAFLDADDLWLPEKLELQIEALRANEYTDLAFTQVVQFDDASGAEREPQAGECPSACLMRRSAWIRVGPMNPELQLGDFIDWVARGREQGLRSVMVEQVLMKRRVHDNNMTRRLRSQSGDYVRLAKAALDRRRAAARPEGALP